MPTLERLCVYCGSAPGREPAYARAAEEVGRELARRGLGLVFGGGRVGLMGAVADAALAAGGEVIGVIPKALMDREVGHRGLTDLRVVGSMHERKLLMADLSDGFLALPGGVGTLEEIVEVWTWSGLGIHAKPCALLDVENYYAPLRAFFDHAAEQGFLRPEHRGTLLVGDRVGPLLDSMVDWRPAQAPPVRVEP